MKNEDDLVVHTGRTFSNINYEDQILENREFIKCDFVSCNFSRSDLSGNDFMDCNFNDCNLSLTIVIDTGFKNTTFTRCKILGVDFSKCNKFLYSFTFIESYLDYSTFYGTKLRKTILKHCSLKESDFEATDLTMSVFENCDLEGTKFVRSVLEKADFRTAKNTGIDPDLNNLKQAKFSHDNLSGLLLKHRLDIS